MKYLRRTSAFLARAALSMALLSGAALAPAFAQDATGWSAPGVMVLPGAAAPQPAAASSQARVATGAYFSCAVTNAGAVKCWGSNYHGELGDGTTDERATPVAVIGLTSGVTGVAAGNSFSCALTSLGGVKCWGDNYSGQVGDGTQINRLRPAAVSGLSRGVVAIAAGVAHTCALTSVGGVNCWGNNRYGQLGDGTRINRSTPVDVSGLSSGVVAIAAGAGHSCALTSFGAVRCWGDNRYGQLGNGTSASHNRRVAVSGLARGVVAIAAGYDHTCALTSAGAAKCWGRNYDGQLGDGTRTDRLTPVYVSGLAGGVAIAAGYTHSCARSSVGGVECWGRNSYGQLGDGSTTDRLTPTTVRSLASVAGIAAGGAHNCAMTSAGAVRCWGFNLFGQLGDGSTTHHSTPVDVRDF